MKRPERAPEEGYQARRPREAVETSPGSGKERMMVYVPAGIRRAVKTLAIDGRCSASDVFVEAVREYLATRGVAVAMEPSASLQLVSPDAARNYTTDVVTALDRQARQIEELTLRLDEAVPQFAVGATGGKPAGTTVAQGMTVLMVALRAAGAEGLDNAQIRAAMVAGSVSSGSSEVAKAVLRDAGIIRKVVQRWVLTMP